MKLLLLKNKSVLCLLSFHRSYDVITVFKFICLKICCEWPQSNDILTSKIHYFKVYYTIPGGNLKISQSPTFFKSHSLNV